MTNQIPLLRIGVVTSTYDATDGERIKVHIMPEDENMENDVYAFPLLPKFLHVKPKINERVLVLTAIATDGNSQRFYIGPIISQPNHMSFEPKELALTTLARGEIKAPEQAQHTIPKTHGAYPGDKDIAIEGRENSGIQITEDDVRIKSGVKRVNQFNKHDVSFNDKGNSNCQFGLPSYVKTEFSEMPNKTENGKEYCSTTSLVGDKIVMIGSNLKKEGYSDGFKVTDKDELISKDEMNKIIDKAHLLPYGDILIEFLEMFRQAFISHVHPISGSAPCYDPVTGTEQLMTFDLNKINSDTFRVS